MSTQAPEMMNGLTRRTLRRMRAMTPIVSVVANESTLRMRVAPSTDLNVSQCGGVACLLTG